MHRLHFSVMQSYRASPSRNQLNKDNDEDTDEDIGENLALMSSGLVPVMLACDWLELYRTKSWHQERQFLHHIHSAWRLAPRLAPRPVLVVVL